MRDGGNRTKKKEKKDGDTKEREKMVDSRVLPGRAGFTLFINIYHVVHLIISFLGKFQLSL